MMWSFLIGSKLGRLASYIGAALVVLLGAVQYGKAKQKAKQEQDSLKEYKETRERIDESHVNVDVDDSLDRLSDNNQLRD